MISVNSRHFNYSIYGHMEAFCVPQVLFLYLALGSVTHMVDLHFRLFHMTNPLMIQQTCKVIS